MMNSKISPKPETTLGMPSGAIGEDAGHIKQGLAKLKGNKGKMIITCHVAPLR
jgi:hypothetical protein